MMTNQQVRQNPSHELAGADLFRGIGVSTLAPSSEGRSLTANSDTRINISFTFIDSFDEVSK